jgi:hypothetical protein
MGTFTESNEEFRKKFSKDGIDHFYNLINKIHNMDSTGSSDPENEIKGNLVFHYFADAKGKGQGTYKPVVIPAIKCTKKGRREPAVCKPGICGRRRKTRKSKCIRGSKAKVQRCSSSSSGGSSSKRRRRRRRGSRKSRRRGTRKSRRSRSRKSRRSRRRRSRSRK